MGSQAGWRRADRRRLRRHSCGHRRRCREALDRERDGVDATSLIADGYRLIHKHFRPEDHPEYGPYDHRLDPLDRYDLAAERPEVVERLARLLDDWRVWATANALPADAELAEELDAEELERLRSLGYLQ